MATKRATKDGWGKRKGHRWTDEEYAKLQELYYGQKIGIGQCSAILGRSYCAIDFKLRTGHKCGAEYGRKTRADDIVVLVPIEVLQDRARRLSASPRDLTAQLCGDPLPGWSALDRANG